MNRWLSALASCLLLACTAADDAPATADANPLAPDADPNAPDADERCGAAPNPSPSWLGSYQDEVVAKLSGARPISTGVTLSDRANATRRGITADYIEAELTAHEYTAQLHDYGTGTNVWAELPATDGGTTWVVLGAHYDSVSGSPGANDNATGVAMVLAVARYLRTVECRSVNVIVVFFDQEEIGLVGSEAFANLLANGSRDVRAVHTVDQMGWDNDGDRAIELERASTGLYELYVATKASGSFTMPLTETNTGSTDHVSFRARGFRAIGLTEEFVSGDTTPHYHVATDTYETVNFAYLASTTALVNHTFAEVLSGNATAAPAPRTRPRALPEGERSFDPVLAPHGCRGASVPSSPMTGAVSGKSSADSF